MYGNNNAQIKALGECCHIVYEDECGSEQETIIHESELTGK